MRQVAGLISTYSSDEFGICSALYELGGMVVMHDASGCNSTYTTHDEPRWYDMDSLIFISAISEMEAIMGDDQKLIDDLIETAEELKPKFIAIVGAPIPYMIGTDFEAIAMIVENATGIPCMGFEANGMNDYSKGISMALERLTERFCMEDMEKEKTETLSVNILGATPLDFSLNGSIDSIREWIVANGMQVNACMAMGSSLEEIQKAGCAHVNLVISYGGLAAAEVLKERYGIPYVVGVPFGTAFADHVSACLQKAASSGEDIIAYKDPAYDYVAKIIRSFMGGTMDMKNQMIIGESVFSASLSAAMELETGRHYQICCPLTSRDDLLREGDLLTPDEDDLMEAVKNCHHVIADPMYRPICRETAFTDLPHEAFSGRIYDAVNPNLIGLDVAEALGIEF